jgi:hypothetical protein
MKFNLRGGVLIIGSLYWQDHLKVEGDDIRKDWRHNRLDLESSLVVRVPIKYGRFSKAGSYTMVFDGALSEEQYGVGKFCPFKKETTSWDDLNKEVTLLSVAEGMKGDFIAGNSAWAVCSILFNPGIDQEVRDFLLTKWKLNLENNSTAFKNIVLHHSDFAISKSGEFSFPWPEGLNDYNFIIATATRPRLREGIAELTVDEISKHIPNRHYFLPNRKHGIITYQDEEILDLL